jgi:hypothetical protein
VCAILYEYIFAMSWIGKQSLLLKAQSIRLKELALKRRKKVTVDANETFANIEKIKEVHDEEARHREAWAKRDTAREACNLSNQLIAKQMEAYMSSWQLDAPDAE